MLEMCDDGLGTGQSRTVLRLALEFAQHDKALGREWKNMKGGIGVENERCFGSPHCSCGPVCTAKRVL